MWKTDGNKEYCARPVISISEQVPVDRKEGRVFAAVMYPHEMRRGVMDAGRETVHTEPHKV
jgi:hypothetical protein